MLNLLKNKIFINKIIKTMKKRFLKKFNLENDYLSQKDEIMGKPHVVVITDPKKIIYCKCDIEPSIDYSKEYFTIEALEDGLTVQLSENASEYRIDDGNWVSLVANTATPSINKEQKIQFKITNPKIYSYDGIGTFTVSKAFNVKGNIMSLLYGDNFEGQIDLSRKDCAFSNLFLNCTTLQNAENLILPATTLRDSCYHSMFKGCTSLTAAPELPATTLVHSCYSYMFYGCTSLTTAPELPATTLANECYRSMFNGCTSLTTAPELPATTLANYCYNFMFYGCTSLTTAPELPATTLANYCYNYMFDGCTSLNKITMLATDISASNCLASWVNNVAAAGTFVKNAAMTSLPMGYDGIPNGWTVEDYNDTTEIDYSKNYLTIVSLEDDNAISVDKNVSYSTDGTTWTALNANEVVTVNANDKVYFKGTESQPKFTSTKAFNAEGNIMSLIYGDDFENQTSLEGKDSCFYGLFKNSKIVSAENLILQATTLADDCYYSMFNGCTGLTTAPELPATTLASYCYETMFKGCTSLTAAPELPATTLADSCYSGMFNGCTGLTTAPELPATTLTDDCYHSMFNGCTSLTTAPELPATTLTYNCYSGMFNGCTSLTAAHELSATTLASGCYTSMFQGCTSLTTAPELSATTLAYGCYSNMFSGCTSLTAAPELPATTLAKDCYRSMFDGCTSLNKITMLATDISASNCLSNWVNGVASEGLFIMHKNMTSLPSGASGIPSGWTITRA